jgi:hypothetical protein
MTFDPLFKVELLNATPKPQALIWEAMHQDYSEGFVADQQTPDEAKAGEICVKRLLAPMLAAFFQLRSPICSFRTLPRPYSWLRGSSPLRWVRLLRYRLYRRFTCLPQR